MKIEIPAGTKPKILYNGTSESVAYRLGTVEVELHKNGSVFIREYATQFRSDCEESVSFQNMEALVKVMKMVETAGKILAEPDAVKAITSARNVEL